MEYFAGLDVSLRSCAICVGDAKGKVMLERELPCEIGDIADCLNSFDYPIERVGFEAGTLSQHLFYGLTGEGFDVVCMEARQVNAALAAMRNKTDKNDARGIAHVLRTGWFSPVHMKSREAHGVRALLSTRKALLNKTIDLANEVRGLLKIFGLRLPKTVQHGSFDGLVRPMIEMDEVLAHAIIPLLDARLALYQHFLELDRRVKRAAARDMLAATAIDMSKDDNDDFYRPPATTTAGLMFPARSKLTVRGFTNLHRASLSLGAALEGVLSKDVALLGRDDERALCQAGFERLRIGAEGLTAALDRLRAQLTSERPYFSADLGPFYHWLRSVYDDPSLTKITALTREHIFKTYPVDLDQYVLGEKPTNEVWLTMEDARARSGFGAVFLKKLLGHMQGVSEVEALMRTDVHVDELRDAKAFWATLANLKEAADALAVSPSQVKVMMSLGMLPNIQITSSLRYTKRDAVLKLLRAVEGLPPTKGGGYLPLRDFCRRDGVALPKAVKAFCEGDLDGAVRRGEGRGLHALEVALDVLKCRPSL
ncbi:transposase [Celeribacter baekdonensis]|uniref:IS110 family transposase n=1 Tax=Celeribacter baekdonensis TaxID=875171 RepID=UPI0030DBC593